MFTKHRTIPHQRGGVGMRQFKSPLAPQMEEFILYRKAGGSWSESYEVLLCNFDRYCKLNHPEEKLLTAEIAKGWCKKKPSENSATLGKRITVLRKFCEYLQITGQTDQYIPNLPSNIFKRLYIPHFFTEQELQHFFKECDNLPVDTVFKQQRAIVFPVLFRLLYSSGMRTGEARKLKCIDVDLCSGITEIKNSKGHKDHFVALNDEMTALLAKYNCTMNLRFPKREYFFPSMNGWCYDASTLSSMFRTSWKRTGIKDKAVAYDLRHCYAITNINQWIGTDEDLQTKFIFLSKSMGHSALSSTYYYYHLVPEFFPKLQQMTSITFDAIIPEAEYEENI